LKILIKKKIASVINSNLIKIEKVKPIKPEIVTNVLLQLFVVKKKFNKFFKMYKIILNLLIFDLKKKDLNFFLESNYFLFTFYSILY
jgi:hypothetical protein